MSEKPIHNHSLITLSGFEKKNCDLAQVEVDEVLGFVCDVRTEVPADDAMPRRVVFFVEFLLDVCRDVFLDVVFLEGLRGAVHGVLLHVLGHVRIFDDGLSVRHLGISSVADEREFFSCKSVRSLAERVNQSAESSGMRREMLLWLVNLRLT